MHEIDIWRIARIPNVFVDDKWKAVMAVKVADLRKSTNKRRRKRKADVDGQQLLAGAVMRDWNEEESGNSQGRAREKCQVFHLVSEWPKIAYFL